MRQIFACGAAVALALGLAACNGHPSAVASQGDANSGAPAYGASSFSQASYGQSAGSTGADASPTAADGKPMWAANRKHSAADNAQYQFARNGREFGARDEADYVAKAHAFVDSPPSDAQTLDRANGDRLIYSPSGNTFAVVSRQGAPRTMFKPRTGAAYWIEQKQREAAQSGQG